LPNTEYFNKDLTWLFLLSPKQLWGEFYGADMEFENIENSKKSSKTKTKIIEKKESKEMVLHPFANFGSHPAGFRM
jgi:hypothetical protein